MEFKLQQLINYMRAMGAGSGPGAVVFIIHVNVSTSLRYKRQYNILCEELQHS